ncbi:hypothetical protein [Paenibacillus mucilaginosus]|uniref:Uncharacterized protein n=1 Tax=Paenibacillus mucilaginosus (strain KNP414) TaxID=1036673 RepID=F8FD28_PAEMK|nr:hypothetical protein [Paenibacillus mucilaginosus]AEI41445.1 hypothetical protein KNP414_02886 [Paenibacillus mucilaginosus KNP414]MCG7217574.1 hypothetical protein [Paenibacillus mucilaginosus]WDM30456.1 hypothetical protein KCX80_15475 [Paenibacillus mucilaginosus]
MRHLLPFILFTAVLAVDLRRLKRGGKRGAAVYLAFLGGAFLLSELYLFHLEPPSPNRIISQLVRLLIPAA